MLGARGRVPAGSTTRASRLRIPGSARRRGAVVELVPGPLARLGAGGRSLAGARPPARFEPFVEGARTSALLPRSCPFGPRRTSSHMRHTQGLCVVSNIARNSLILWNTLCRRGRRDQRGGAVSYPRYRTLQTPETQPSSRGREHRRSVRAGVEVPRVRSRAYYDGGARRDARLTRLLAGRERRCRPCRGSYLRADGRPLGERPVPAGPWGAISANIGRYLKENRPPALQKANQSKYILHWYPLLR